MVTKCRWPEWAVDSTSVAGGIAEAPIMPAINIHRHRCAGQWRGGRGAAAHHRRLGEQGAVMGLWCGTASRCIGLAAVTDPDVGRGTGAGRRLSCRFCCSEHGIVLGGVCEHRPISQPCCHRCWRPRHAHLRWCRRSTHRCQ